MQVFGPTVRFNVQCTPTRHSYDQFRDNWLLCERLGFDVAYSTDHFVAGQPDHSVLEGPTVLSASIRWISFRFCSVKATRFFRDPPART